MKIELFTYFSADNYGATLQTYSTIKILEKLGHCVELANYKIPEPKHSILKKILLYPKHLRFNRFRNKYFLNISENFCSYKDLYERPPLADCYLTGSDQTWNPEISKNMAPGFFLNFGDDNILRGSYSASIGMDQWEDTIWINKNDVKKALLAGKHVLCESPIAYTREQCRELFQLAKVNDLILMDAIKTAYSTAYERLILMAKSGKIGKVVSVDAVCTSLRDGISIEGTDLTKKWNSMCGWAPAAMLPVFQIFGTDYKSKVFYTMFQDKDANIDAFTKIDFVYPTGVATVKVAKGAKAEGELIISGTKGYIYVPAPWWKTDYFEVRYENPEDNKRFFYQLDGEGIRYEIVAFAKAIESNINMSYISKSISTSIVEVIEDFNIRKDMKEFC